MKSHTCFRFVPIPMTLNGLERCNSPYFAFLPNSIALLTDYVTVVEERLTISVKYCLWVPVFHFRPKLMYPAARSLCDSWASCFKFTNIFSGEIILKIGHDLMKLLPWIGPVLGGITSTSWIRKCLILFFFYFEMVSCSVVDV